MDRRGRLLWRTYLHRGNHLRDCIMTLHIAPQRLATGTPEFNALGRQGYRVNVALNGVHQRHVVAYDRKAGWIDRHAYDEMNKRFIIIGNHQWTFWGPWIPAPPRPLPGITRDEPPAPVYTPIEAYRWRYCECGAAERETHADGKIKRFEPGDDT
jgi:hypothetical protein